MANKPMNQFPQLEAVPLGDGNFAMAQAIVNTDGLQLGSFMGPRLKKGGTGGVSKTMTLANTDYAAAAAMPAGTKYVVVYCAAAVIVAMGEVTTTTLGVYIAAAQPRIFPVTVTGVTADDTPHSQSASAGAVIFYTYMTD